ncbi:MAG: YedE family putative selenium transporter [Eubacteriales bacterium]|nr:YedE family putative selenium transporter [Eubacteriales bacterium]
MKKEYYKIIFAGIIIGIISTALVLFGNPKNMGFCIACFIRDTAGAMKLHSASAVQYVRPEIIGLILGSFILSMFSKEHKAVGGSSPITRFILGFFAMVGALMFLGCPFRMILRLAGGDYNAILGLFGFIVGIGIGVFFLKKGYSLNRTYEIKKIDGNIFPIIQVIILILFVAFPALFALSSEPNVPGGMHAPIIISLVAGLIVGALAQKTRFCMMGGIRDIILFKDFKLISGFVAVLISALIMNIIFKKFTPGFEGQAIAHSDFLWNFLGTLLLGFASVLLGGCPLRQLILTGEGNVDSAITFLGYFVGAAFCHNFSLASSGKGPTLNGKIAVIFGIIVVTIIAIVNSKKEKKV